MKSPLLHLASIIFDSPLAIMPEKLETILSVVGPRITADHAAIQTLLSSGAFRTRGDGGDPRELLAYWDDEDDGSSNRDRGGNKKPYRVTEAGIAVIPVSGTLMKKATWMSSLSGCTSYLSIAGAVSCALNDASVRGILLDVDSPGGTTHGCFEVADYLHSIRGQKPFYAVANDLAASAAFAIASAADRVFVTRTGGVGSVGVFALHRDVSGADQQNGVAYTYVHFGSKKVDGNEHSPLSKSARKDIQAEVDREGDMFVSTVARNRGKAYNAVLNTEAAVFFAAGAIPLFADEVGTYDDALAAVTSKVMGFTPVGKKAVSTGAATMSAAVSGPEVSEEQQVAETGYTPKNATKPAVVATTSPALEPPDEMVPAPAPAPAPAPSAAAGTKATDYADDEMKKGAGKKGASKKGASDPDDDGDDDSDPDADPDKKKDEEEVDAEDTKPAKTGKKASAPIKPMLTPTAETTETHSDHSDASIEVAELCALAGCPERLGEFITGKKSAAEVRKLLSVERAAASTKETVTTGFGNVSADALDKIIAQANTAVANSAHPLTSSAAIERVLRSNPSLYEAFEEERYAAMQNPMSKKKYAGLLDERFRQMGLSTTR